ncbi:MAG: ABC transporter ATP-binding protein, partial [bacterium]
MSKDNHMVKRGMAGRVIKTVFQLNPVLLPLTLLLIVANAIIGAIPSVFQQKVIAVIEEALGNQLTWSQVSGRIAALMLTLVCLYVVSLMANIGYNQLMAIITQGTLAKLRIKMFEKMETLPIGYFDSHAHGDIMSTYTNDTDTLRQMISQSFPQLLATLITLTTIFCIMVYYSVWLTAVVILGLVLMLFLTKVIGGKSAVYFIKQQRTLAETEGFIEEIMNGQKVVKVFNHEDESRRRFDEFNDNWFDAAEKANRYGNILGPILHNMSNILYVIVAIVGGTLLLLKVPNLSVSGMAIGISIVVPFLNMTKQFTGSIGQISHQINSVIMGLAGASRIFELLDQEPESDEGYVTLVNCREENGQIVECDERTFEWAWKHPHKDGTVTYTKLTGDVILEDVDFSYVPGKVILHDINIHVKPGQKFAFVGATGAGKTTITNLINRFYDIQDGKIRYDGINIYKIKKSSLRKSLGVVLQETNL